MKGLFITTAKINSRDLIESVLACFFVPQRVRVNLQQRYLAFAYCCDSAYVANIWIDLFPMNRHQRKSSIC